MRDVSDWHNDTFVNGPSWEEFTKAMAISDDAKSKNRGSVYVVWFFGPRQDIVRIWKIYYQRHRIVPATLLLVPSLCSISKVPRGLF